ncbi:MAG: HEPN domain-containing protein [Vulcanococcus sp. Clear-D1]|nr:HEPN domain-containing protein [Vulcanococcus sp. Clear-D1]
MGGSATADHQSLTSSNHLFPLQQCAEKLLKAALLASGGAIPKTHDLNTLSTLLSGLDPTWVWDLDVLEELSTNAVASRYPGDTLDPQDAVNTTHRAGELRSALLKRLAF